METEKSIKSGRLGLTSTLLLFTVCLATGCEVVRTFDDTLPGSSERETDSGTDEIPTDDSSTGDAPTDEIPTDETPPCPAALSDRLTVTEVPVDEDIHYLQPGYNLVPTLSRVILTREPSGLSVVGWQSAVMDTVHVTLLTETFDRRGADIQIPGIDLGGLAAHDDGFALLTRRPDTGDPIASEEDAPAEAAVLTRYTNGVEVFHAYLTGTNGLSPSLDYSNYLRGALRWNGERYGAYFEVRGGIGSGRQGLYGDKLVYVDDTGALETGGWAFASSTVTDLALVAETGDFLALCLPDGTPAPGLNLITGKDTSQLLSREETWSGYNGGAFGGLVTLSSGGYAIAWASRGYDEVGGAAQREAHDAAMLFLSSDRTPTGDLLWLTDTPDVDEINVHIAPYGPDLLLLVWNAVEELDCSSPGTCLGTYGGTYFQLYNLSGEPMGPSERIAAPPTAEQDFAVYDNGDVAFAFVTDAPDYSGRFNALYGTAPPAKRAIQIARLRYCEEDVQP